MQNVMASKGEVKDSEDRATRFNEAMEAISKAGTVDGEHYTNKVEEVKQLKREGRNIEAIEILLRCVNATEAESRLAGKGWGVAPWYYEQIAILYRKQRLFDKEVEILERYANQPKAPGVGPKKLANRLIKARELLSKGEA